VVSRLRWSLNTKDKHEAFDSNSPTRNNGAFWAESRSG
jgi:hypothetical protein